MWQGLIGSSLDCGLFPGFGADLAGRSRNFAWMASSLASSSWAAQMESLVGASSHVELLMFHNQQNLFVGGTDEVPW